MNVYSKCVVLKMSYGGECLWGNVRSGGDEGEEVKGGYEKAVMSLLKIERVEYVIDLCLDWVARRKGWEDGKMGRVK